MPATNPPSGGSKPDLHYSDTATRHRTSNDMSTARCQELLAQHSTGRIAWTAADGPQLYPISYARHENLIIFRTSPFGVLSELVQPTAVVFEIDELDQTRRTGWSILVRGSATGIASPAQLNRLWTIDGALPWASGARSLFIGITPHKITGRSFHHTADPDLDDRP